MSIFVELNRRNIFRVALLYIVATWLLLQLLNILFGLLGFPDWIFRFIFALLIICFPLTLVFSWIFEITPEGIKREQQIETRASITSQTGKKISRATRILLISAILLWLAGQLIPELKANPGIILPPRPALQAIEQHNGAGSPGKSFDLQGHRGARGLMPENTIPAFLLALDIGVTTLEMDVVINSQRHVVLSHEPWISEKICSHGDGRPVSKIEAKKLNIYTLNDEQLAAFDCGSRGHPDYPRQQAMSQSKPLLSDVFKAVAAHTYESGRKPAMFNIEIKSRPDRDGVYYPEVAEYAALLYAVIVEHDVLRQTTVQSFDPRALEEQHRLDPEVTTALLVDNRKGFEKNLARLSFVPDIYSPDYKRVTMGLIKAAHAKNIKVIPWTVNDPGAMNKLIDMGVDGLITDYPDIAIDLLGR